MCSKLLVGQYSQNTTNSRSDPSPAATAMNNQSCPPPLIINMKRRSAGVGISIAGLGPHSTLRLSDASVFMHSALLGTLARRQLPGIRALRDWCHLANPLSCSRESDDALVETLVRQETVFTRQSAGVNGLLGASLIGSNHAVICMRNTDAARGSQLPPKRHRLRLRIPSMYCLASMPIPSANLPGFHPLLVLDPSS